MKNIHVLPTDNYAPLVHSTNKYGGYFKSEHYSPMKEMGDSYQHIYITSDEEIKDNDWVYCPVLKKPVFICLDSILMFKNLGYDSNGNSKYKKEWLKKIILTTDSDLIKDGVQAIDDEFLDWFVKNSSCEWVETKLIEEIPSGFTFGMFGNDEPPTELVYKIIIPKEESEQETVGKQFYKTADMVISVVRNKETLEEAAKDYIENTMKFSFNSLETKTQANRMLKCVEFGAKWQSERMYSEEEVLELILKSKIETSNLYYEDMKEWFEQIKKK